VASKGFANIFIYIQNKVRFYQLISYKELNFKTREVIAVYDSMTEEAKQ